MSGTLEPAAEGQEVVVAFAGVEVGRVLTDVAGAYEFTFTPRRGGDVAVSLTADPAVAAAPLALAVKPKVTVSHGTLVPFLRSRFVVKVAPTAYDGVIVLKVVHRRALAGTYRARVKDGRAVFQVPLRGVDGFTLTYVLPATGGLTGRTVQSRVSVRARTLSAGSSGPYVKGMLTALQRLRFRVPNVGSGFTTQVKDSVMAFQKAYRLPRTYVFNSECWRKLDGAKVIRPRYVKPSTHIEVDKARQILMIVKGGKPYGIICVSTGATGNTPEGTFRIQQKHPYTQLGVRRHPGPDHGLPRRLRHPRVGGRAALPGQPRLRARAHLGLLLDLRQFLGRRDRLHLSLTRRRADEGPGAGVTSGAPAPWSRAGAPRGRRPA